MAQGDTFGAAFRAVEQGLVLPAASEAAGEIPNDETSSRSFSDDSPTIARPNVLERRGHYEEYP